MQGCVLWQNWWPLLTAFMYVLVPMPYLFFGSASGGSSSIYGGSSLASGYACTAFSMEALPSLGFIHPSDVTGRMCGLALLPVSSRTQSIQVCGKSCACVQCQFPMPSATHVLVFTCTRVQVGGCGKVLDRVLGDRVHCNSCNSVPC